MISKFRSNNSVAGRVLRGNCFSWLRERAILPAVAFLLLALSGKPGRESIVQALEGLQTFNIGLGESLILSKTEHQASHRVWPAVLRGGKFVPLKWEELAAEERTKP